MIERVWDRLTAYLQLASMMAQIEYTYRSALIISLVSILFKVYLAKLVWTAVYANRASVDGIPLQVLVAYITLASLQTWVLSASLSIFLRRRFREGVIAFDLMRPVGFIEQLVAFQSGKTLGLLPFLIIAFPLACVLGGIVPPASIQMAIVYVLSLSLAYLVAVLLNLLLGFITFWTIETSGFSITFQFVSQFFAGTLIPFWFFPAILRGIAELLPFQSLAFIPVAIYLGQLSGNTLIRALSVQIFWVVALYLLVSFVWRRAMRRVLIQGG